MESRNLTTCSLQICSRVQEILNSGNSCLRSTQLKSATASLRILVKQANCRVMLIKIRRWSGRWFPDEKLQGVCCKRHDRAHDHSSSSCRAGINREPVLWTKRRDRVCKTKRCVEHSSACPDSRRGYY